MAKIKKWQPLTEQEKVFAEQHCKLVLSFLHKKKLEFEEWYDVAMIGYLKAIKNWFEREDLHKYSFSTIAFYVMRCEVGNERRKQQKSVKTISLDAVMQQDFTLADVITSKNLVYVAYIEGDDMKITYNTEIPAAMNSDRKSEAIIALDKFLLSDNKTMCFDLEADKKEAQKTYSRIQTRRKKLQEHGLYNIYKRGNCVYIEKTQAFLEKVEQEKAKRASVSKEEKMYDRAEGRNTLAIQS